MATAKSTIDSSLLESLATKGTTTIIISFKVGTGNVLQQLEGREFPTREARTQAVHDLLSGHANTVQAPVVTFLQSKVTENPDLTFETLWISNNLVVKNADQALVQLLADFEEIELIKENQIVAHVNKQLNLGGQGQ